jgi:hypothetical protein
MLKETVVVDGSHVFIWLSFLHNSIGGNSFPVTIQEIFIVGKSLEFTSNL